MSVIVGIAGRAGAGKDTAAKAFVEEGFKVMKFAEPIKEMLRTLLRMQGAEEETIERMIGGDLKEIPSPYLSGQTPRHAMQTLGTTWGRLCMDERFWVDILLRRAALEPQVVITDVRFPNEANALADKAHLIRIVRPDAEQNNSHVSETLVETLTVDEEIVNDCTSAEAFVEKCRKEFFS